MQDQERPKTDPSSDDDDDDADDGGNVPSPRLSTEAARSKSEQDLARTYSLDLLMVCCYSYYYLLSICLTGHFLQSYFGLDRVP